MAARNRKQKKNVVQPTELFKSKMNRNVRDKGSSEDITLKRPGIHDRRLYDTYHPEESQYWPCNIQSSRGNVGNSTPLRKKEENGTFFKQMLSKNLIVVVTVLVVILGVGVEVLFPPLAAEERGYRQFSASLRSFQKTFLNQTEQLWHVSLTATKPVLLQKSPKHPAVIFLKGSKRSEAVTDCLARKLSESVNNAFDARTPVFIFDCRIYQDWDADKVKQEINETLTKTFKSGTKVAVILALESLPGDSPMIFSRFSNEADAPFKKVVLILTLNEEQQSTSETDKEAQKDRTRLQEPAVAKDQVDMTLNEEQQSTSETDKEAQKDRTRLQEPAVAKDQVDKTLNEEQQSTSETDKEAQKDRTRLQEPAVAKDQVDMLLGHFKKSVAYVRDEENHLNCVAGKG